MKTIFIILSIVVFVEWIIIWIKILEIKQLNHLPTFDYSFNEVCFEITNIKSTMFNIVEYTAVVSFFKKPNAKHFVYNEYKFYDKKDKYSIGDKLYLTKK